MPSLRRFRSLLLPLTLAGLALSRPALAEPTPEDRAAAQALFDDGRSLVKAGHVAEACPKFEDSQRLDPGLGTMLYLADCYERAGRIASAWATFVDAAEVASKAGDKRVVVAQTSATRLAPSVPRVRVVVPPGVEGLTVFRDGKQLPGAAMTTALPTDPGKRSFEGRAPGRSPARLEVDVTLETKEVVLPPLALLAVIASSQSGAAPSPAGPPPEAPVRGSSGLGTVRIAALATGGVGVVAMGIGAILGAAAKSKNDSAKADGCRSDGTFCTPAALSQHDSAASEATVANVAILGGGVLLAAGVTLFVLGAPSERQIAVRVSPSQLTVGGAF